MTAPVQRPGEWRTLGDHERRIRILEAICCGGGGTGFDQAVAIRDRACYWFGLGDGSTSNGSVVNNFGSGADGSLTIAAESALETGTPGTVGASVEDTHAWPLAQDIKSFAGFQKNFCNFGGYAADPNVALPAGAAIGTGFDWTINMWVRWDGYSTFCAGAGVDIYGYSAAWGFRNSSNIGIWLAVDGGSVITGNPAPAPVLRFNINTGDGAGGVHVNSLSAGQLVPGQWQMVTCVFDVIGTLTEMFLYVNGGLVGSGIVTVGTGIAGTVPTIGSVNFGGALGTNYGTFYGLLDECGMWVGDCGEALIGADVATLYYAGNPP